MCDTDIDSDNVDNMNDNCPYLYNPLQTDINGKKNLVPKIISLQNMYLSLAADSNG